MEHDPSLAAVIREIAAPNAVWTMQETPLRLLEEALRRLPKAEVSDEERRYPTTPQGMRAFMDGFFARHFFQTQDSLVEYFASPAFEAVARRGYIHVADVGSGPSVASLAIADLVCTTIAAIRQMGRIRSAGRMAVHVALNDTSEICLAEGRSLLKRYNRGGNEPISIRRIIPISTPFSNSITQFRRIAGMTEPYDLCCLGYVMIPLSEQVGAQAFADGIHQLVQAGHGNGGRLLLIQDRFHENLHRQICHRLGTSAETADLKQRVYDSENQNSEHTYTYCRSRSPLSKVSGLTHSAVA
ncbi:MAG TPA: hypothetical protein VFH53_10530 [Phycisphaerae bacterium]|nr:hypothetical protein [Phycisphaerae bacterium]